MIEVFCMDDCPNCDRLCAMLNKESIAYTQYNIDKDPGALAEAGFRGILEQPFPVVFINGSRIEPMTPQGYMERIR